MYNTQLQSAYNLHGVIRHGWLGVMTEIIRDLFLHNKQNIDLALLQWKQWESSEAATCPPLLSRWSPGPPWGLSWGWPGPSPSLPSFHSLNLLRPCLRLITDHKGENYLKQVVFVCSDLVWWTLKFVVLHKVLPQTAQDKQRHRHKHKQPCNPGLHITKTKTVVFFPPVFSCRTGAGLMKEKYPSPPARSIYFGLYWLPFLISRKNQ